MLTEAIASHPIEAMTARDVPAALDLVAEAGWNQVEDDWHLMLSVGQGFCVRDGAGRAVASSLVLPYRDGGFGWISMVLVQGRYRKQGLATRLLRNAITLLQESGLTPVLDATPAGRKVYEPLGFRPLGDLSRWRGMGHGRGTAIAPPIEHVDAAVAADRNAFGASRGAIITSLATRSGSLFVVAPDHSGFLIGRQGRTAVQIGPVISESEEFAVTLVDRVLEQVSGPVLLDLPAGELGLAAMLRRRGFTVERPFTRMALGSARALDDAPQMRVIAGPELG